MEAIFETDREKDLDVETMVNKKPDYPPHFHINVEIFIVKGGEYSVLCNGKSYVMTAGSVAFFDSYDIHAYTTVNCDGLDNILFIVPLNVLKKFTSYKNANGVANPILTNPKLVNQIYDIYYQFIFNNDDKVIVECAVDLIISLIESNFTYFEKKELNDTILVKKILEFINKNFKYDVRLSCIAKSLGYTAEHISRTFHKYMKKSIPSYTNGLRLNYIEKNLGADDKSLTQLIYDAGFNSVQTYYRNKKLNNAK